MCYVVLASSVVCSLYELCFVMCYFILLSSASDLSSLILKDPVLFTGSMRKNLDPFNQHTDEELWNALQEVSATRSSVYFNSATSQPLETVFFGQVS